MRGRAALLVLTGVVLLSTRGVAFEDTAVFDAFKAVFPFKDGSEVLVEEAVFLLEAQYHLDLLGVPHNLSAFCSLPEEEVMLVLMKASLGNLVLRDDDTAAGKIRQPYLANPLTGKLQYVDNYTTNRVMILQVLIFCLLVALARSWYLLDHGGEGEQAEVNMPAMQGMQSRLLSEQAFRRSYPAQAALMHRQ